MIVSTEGNLNYTSQVGKEDVTELVSQFKKQFWLEVQG